MASSGFPFCLRYPLALSYYAKGTGEKARGVRWLDGVDVSHPPRYFLPVQSTWRAVLLLALLIKPPGAHNSLQMDIGIPREVMAVRENSTVVIIISLAF